MVLLIFMENILLTRLETEKWLNLAVVGGLCQLVFLVLYNMIIN
ncbi:MAG: hypothetical protein DDT40_01935 [candidate division WS2 bacterium]|nr:hypothetical protein [Candidatus Psychracetigena formicireducens]